MTTKHTPTPAASNFPLTAVPTGSVERIMTAHPNPVVVASCHPEWAAFFVHAANHHEALRAINADLVACLKEIEEWGHHPIPHKVRAAIANGSRILSESATQ